MTSFTPWHIDGDTAHLTLHDFTADVCIARPDLGLHALCFSASHVDSAASAPRVAAQSLNTAHLLALELGDSAHRWPAPGESFVRGNDLIATYPESDQLPFRVQVYWRAGLDASPECRATIDVQVSVQTSLLDAWPVLSFGSRFASHAVRRLDPAARGDDAPVARHGALPVMTRHDTAGCWLWRAAAWDVSCAVMAHPADVQWEEIAFSDAQCAELTQRLFARSLEKGVILRARARAVVVNATADEPAARRAYERFLAAPLPLTT